MCPQRPRTRQREAILAPEDEAARPGREPAARRAGLPRARPGARMTGYPVSTAVNAVANDGSELVEPLARA